MSTSVTRRGLLGTIGATAAGGLTATGHASATQADQPDAPRRRVAFDTARERIGSVEVEGDRHTLYRYENAVDTDASGIDIYGPNGRITDKALADLTCYNRAWFETIRELLEADIDSAANEIIDKTSLVEVVLDPIVGVLNTAVALLDQAKAFDPSVANVTIDVWDIATTKYPILETIDKVIRSAHDFTSEWLDAVVPVNRELPSMQTLLDRTEDAMNADYNAFEEQAKATTAALDTLQNTTTDLLDTIEQLRDRAEELVDTTANLLTGMIDAIEEEFNPTVAEAAEAASQTVITPFIESMREVRQLADQVVQEALEPVREFVDTVSSLIDTFRVVDPTTNRHQSLLAGWLDRQDAEQVVMTRGVMLTFVTSLAAVFFWSAPGGAIGRLTRLGFLGGGSS